MHAIELILYLRGATPDDIDHTQLEAATINHLHTPITNIMFGCSGT